MFPASHVECLCNMDEAIIFVLLIFRSIWCGACGAKGKSEIMTDRRDGSEIQTPQHNTGLLDNHPLRMSQHSVSGNMCTYKRATRFACHHSQFLGKCTPSRQPPASLFTTLRSGNVCTYYRATRFACHNTQFLGTCAPIRDPPASHVTTLSFLEHVHLSEIHPLRVSPLLVSGNMCTYWRATRFACHPSQFLGTCALIREPPTSHVTTLSFWEHVHLSESHPLRMPPLAVSGNTCTY
jgi:hypothetical protein